MSTKPSLDAALARTQPEKASRREKVYNAKSNPGRRGLRGITSYVLPGTLEDLRAIAEERSNLEDEEVMLKDVVREALNLVLVKYGKKPTA